MPTVRIRRLLAVVAVLFIVSCAQTPPAGAPRGGSSDASARANAGNAGERGDLFSEYRIGAEDQLEINVWRNDDLSIDVPVRPDGMISVPLIGDVEAGGRTPEEVGAAIERELAEYVRDPRVTVIVTELNSHEYLARVRVTGAVEEAVSLPYRQGMTVLDLVLEAGGVSEFAAPNRTKLYRRVRGETRTLEIRLDDILEDGDLDTNVALQPGDVIAVPERLF